MKVQLESFKAFQEGYRIIVNQGGTSSGKTRGITKLLIGLAYKDKYEISMTSLSFPHLRKGVLRDWRTVMEQYELYNVNDHVRTEQTYNYPTGSYIEFFSVDDHLKVRGPRRDILFINEANLITFDTFLQLLLRTRKTVFIDYNPADEFHWIYDKVLTRSDCKFIQSTYLDNPFLPDEQIKEIENLRTVDENYWKVYGLGERGHSEGVIYTHWSTFSTINGTSDVFGLDFGYNNPTALVRIREKEKALYATEEFYQSGVTNSELINVLKQIVKPGELILCDAAEPQRIEEIRRAGFRAESANKDVKAGIDFIKSRKLFIHEGSINLLKEIKSYKYKTKGQKITNTPEEPLKLNDHACFTADSMVITDQGEKPIADICKGDLVLTSKGLKPVLNMWDNGLKLIKSYWLHFDTISLNLNCTPDHLISTDQGWIQISKLESGMILNLSSSSMAGSILSTQGKDIFASISMQCTGTFGNFTMAEGRSDSMFTTLMKTHGTTELKIYNSKKHLNTCQRMLKKGIKKIKRGRKRLQKKVLRPLKRGIKALKEMIGIDSTRLITISEGRHTDQASAKFADLILKGRRPPIDFAIQTARLKRLEEGEESYEQVYDLTVAECHEYFVSGVLVHNCDAMRYGAIHFRRHKTGLNLTFHR